MQLLLWVSYPIPWPCLDNSNCISERGIAGCHHGSLGGKCCLLIPVDCGNDSEAGKNRQQLPAGGLPQLPTNGGLI